MNPSYNECEVLELLQDESTQKRGFELIVAQYSEQLYWQIRRMVLLHELTHYKRKDLLVKWFAVLVNAVHWFNPLCYLACAALSEACEVSCDMAVTKNMTEEEQKLYMQTILHLAAERS